MLQELLKELSIKKKSFNNTKEKMLSEMNKNCYKYLKGRINVKKIFDHILNDSTKINKNKDILIQDSKESLKDLYEPLYNFYFLLQNDNSLMVKIIESNPIYIEELSDFIVHFLYVDITNNSFNEDRLILLIYLLLEKQIRNPFPDIYLKDSFILNIFKSLTRKIDLRNFLGSVLNKVILNINNFRNDLTVDIKEVNKNLNWKASSFKDNNNQEKKKLFESNIQSKFDKYIKDKESLLEKAKKVKIIINENDYNHEGNEIIEKKFSDDSFSDDFIIIDDQGDIKKNEDTNKKETVFKKRKTFEKEEPKKEKEKENNYWNLEDEDLKVQKKQKSDEQLLFENFEISRTEIEPASHDQNVTNNNKKDTLTINKFFKDNDITKRKINEVLEDYINLNDKNNNILIAMKEYLNNLLKMYKDKIDKDGEIYSSSFFIKDLITIGEKQSEDHFKKLMKKIVRSKKSSHYNNFNKKYNKSNFQKN